MAAYDLWYSTAKLRLMRVLLYASAYVLTAIHIKAETAASKHYTSSKCLETNDVRKTEKKESTPACRSLTVLGKLIKCRRCATNPECSNLVQPCMTEFRYRCSIATGPSDRTRGDW